MIALFQDDASRLSPFFFDSILYRKHVKRRHETKLVEERKTDVATAVSDVRAQSRGKRTAQLHG